LSRWRRSGNSTGRTKGPTRSITTIQVKSPWKFIVVT
jgi:hypothetical protein